MVLGVEAFLDSLFKQAKELLDVRECRLGIVVIVHQSVVVVVPFRQIVVNHKARLLHSGAPVFESLRDFFGSLLQRAI